MNYCECLNQDSKQASVMKSSLLLYWLLYSDRFTSYLIMALIPYH